MGILRCRRLSPSRLRRNQSEVVVLNYMAHHQGMILLALANALDDQVITKWFHSNPYVRANELLLQEKVPELVAIDVPSAEAAEPVPSSRVVNTFVSRQIKGVYSTPQSPSVVQWPVQYDAHSRRWWLRSIQGLTGNPLALRHHA